MNPKPRPCPCGSGRWSTWAYDARNIPLFRTCTECHTRKMDGIREDVRNNPNYEADEAFDED